MRILFPLIAYTHDDLCRESETVFNHSVKGAELFKRNTVLEVGESHTYDPPTARVSRDGRMKKYANKSQ